MFKIFEIENHVELVKNFTNTKRPMRQFFYFLIILIFSSCEKKESAETKRVIENIFGFWNIKLSDDWTELSTAKINFRKDKTYQYFGRNDLKDSLFSKGMWFIKSDTLILNSEKINTCCYSINGISFQCKNFNRSNSENGVVIKQYFELPTTVANCHPKIKNNLYAEFKDEKFLIRNDSLIYLPPLYDCSKYFPEIKLMISKQ